MNLNKFLMEQNGKSGIAVLKAPLCPEDYSLPFKQYSTTYLNDVDYELFAELKIKFCSEVETSRTSLITVSIILNCILHKVSGKIFNGCVPKCSHILSDFYKSELFLSVCHKNPKLASFSSLRYSFQI